MEGHGQSSVGKRWNSDDWGGYARVLPPEIVHYIGKDQTQPYAFGGAKLYRAHEWHREATDGQMAPTAESVWQAVGANESNDAISGELLQLDLAAQSVEDNGGSTGRAD